MSVEPCIAALKSFVRDKVDRYAFKAEAAVEETTKEIREDIIEEWFAGYNSGSTIAAQEYSTKGINVDEYDIEIVCRNWMDVGAYGPDTSSAQRWVDKHGGGMAPNEWIAYVQWQRGYIALPPDGVPSLYEGPLEEQALHSGRWGAFEASVKSKL